MIQLNLMLRRDADGNASYYQKIRIRELAYDNLMSGNWQKRQIFFLNS